MTLSPPAIRPGILNEDAERIAIALGPAVHAFEGSRVLVTGAAGFLPAYVVTALAWLNRHVLSRPCQITALVRRPQEPADRLSFLAGAGDVRFLVQNVRDALPDDVAADFIVHGASPASPKAYLADPMAAIDANVWGTRMLLERARQWDSRSMVFLSSSEPYGSPPNDKIPTPETYAGQVDPLAARAVYTETKRMGETLCATYARSFGVRAKIARPFHTYGPGVQLDDGRIMGEFLRQRLEGKAIAANSAGLGIRSFCYVGDATAGFLAALLSDQNGEAFNIGDDREPVTIRELAHLVAEVVEPKLPVQLAAAPNAPLMQGTPDRVQPDLAKARRVLGYQPRIGLREGIVRTLTAFAQAKTAGQ